MDNMVFDSDRVKAMGDNFVSLTADQVVVPDKEEGKATEPQTDVAKEEAPAAQADTTAVSADTQTIAQGEPVTEEKKEEEKKEMTDEDVNNIIDQILGEADSAKKDVEEQEQKVTEQAKAVGDESLKKELEEYKLKVEEMNVKNSAVVKAYKDLLDQKTNLEAMNDEYTRKMQLISDNPLLQDLMRGLYLQGKDPTAITSVESTLKELLKQYANIDVDNLVGKARGSGANALAPDGGSEAVSMNNTYKGLFGEGDILPLS